MWGMCLATWEWDMPNPVLTHQFVQGWEPRVIWIAVGGCVFFTALEAAKKLYAPKAAHLK